METTLLLRCKQYLARHALALICAVAVGMVTISPVLVFRATLGPDFKGMHFLVMDDEEWYMTRMHEILDGHPLIGSMFMFEYKNAWPLMPPTVETTYVAISQLFRLSLPQTLIVGKFVLPALLFFLVYRFMQRLTGAEASRTALLATLAGAFLTTLGFDLIDYHQVLNLLRWSDSARGMVLWARPVNPVSGAVLLFAFLNCLWLVCVETKRRWIVPGAVCLALMIGSYFFSWSLALAVSGIVALFYLYKKQLALVRDSVLIVVLGVALSAPYWFMVYQARLNPLFQDSATRFGLMLTHTPLFNKLLFIATILLLAGAYVYFKRPENAPHNEQPHWFYFSLAMFIGGWAALNQQVITGQTVWPFHYVSYTIPFSYCVLLTLAYRLGATRFPRLTTAFFVFIIGASTVFAVGREVLMYRHQFTPFVERQNWMELFAWLNRETPKESVIFVTMEAKPLDQFIAAYTHNNVYATEPGYVLAPYERFHHNYLSLLRFKGVQGAEIEAYLSTHRREAVDYLYNHIIVGAPTGTFLDIKDTALEKTLNELPEKYRSFAQRDFLTELKRYRIDYVLSRGALPPPLLKELGSPALVFENAGLFLYKLDS